MKSLTSPGQRVEWMAKLGGLAVVSSDYAMGSQMGPWIKFRGIAELGPLRHLLLDKRFQDKHPSLTAILKQHFGKTKSMWRITVARLNCFEGTRPPVVRKSEYVRMSAMTCHFDLITGNVNVTPLL